MEKFAMNGVPLIEGTSQRQIGMVMKAREVIQNTTVLEPLFYEPPVPRVLSFNTTHVEQKDKGKPNTKTSKKTSKKTKGKTKNGKGAKGE